MPSLRGFHQAVAEDIPAASSRQQEKGGNGGCERAGEPTWLGRQFLRLTGWLTRRFGQVKLFTAAVLLFVIASFLCALAPSLPILIMARILQGAVAGPMIPLSQALLLTSYPRNRAGMALAMWSITTVISGKCVPP